MSKQTVYLAVDFAINDGQLGSFEGIAQTMVAGTQKEAGALAYEWYFSADRKKCRLIETYADANAVLAHINGPVVQELVPKLLGTSIITAFEVYGDPGPKATEMLKGIGPRSSTSAEDWTADPLPTGETASFADQPFTGLLASD